LNEQEAKEIRSQINVYESEAAKNVTEIEGGANANAEKIVADSKASAETLKIEATAKAYAGLATNAGIKANSKLD